MYISSIFEVIVLASTDFLQWYADEALSGTDIFIFLIKQLFLYFILQAILMVIPFVKRIVSLVWFPFRVVHVYLHIYTGKEISYEINQKYRDNEELDSLLDYHTLRSSLLIGVNRDDENPAMIASYNRLEYASKVATTPSHFAWVMLLAYLIISPFTFAGNVFTSVTGALIHFYFFVGIFGVMLPSLNDWVFVFHILLLNLDIRPRYFYNGILVHVVFTFDAFWRTGDFLIAVLTGTLLFLFYIVVLFGVAWFAQRGGQLRESGIYIVPFRHPRELQPQPPDSGIDFAADESVFD